MLCIHNIINNYFRRVPMVLLLARHATPAKLHPKDNVLTPLLLTIAFVLAMMPTVWNATSRAVVNQNIKIKYDHKCIWDLYLIVSLQWLRNMHLLRNKCRCKITSENCLFIWVTFPDWHGGATHYLIFDRCLTIYGNLYFLFRPISWREMDPLWTLSVHESHIRFNNISLRAIS